MPRASLGSVFRKRYRDRTGRLRQTTNWYIEYTLPRRSQRRREATPFTNKADAQRLLRQRMGDADAGRIALNPDLSFDDLKRLIVTDYEINRRDTLYELRHTRLPKLTEFFGSLKAADIRTHDVEQYKRWRLGAGASESGTPRPSPAQLLGSPGALDRGAAHATVNRELSALRRMFRLAIDQELIGTKPRIVLLNEDNVRTGFFEWSDFVTFLAHLPPHFRRLFELAYITGWRVRSELLSRRWCHVDFTGLGCLRLEPGEAKDGREGREFPFTDWMRKVLEDQRQFVRTVERQTGQIIPWVFCRPNGRRLRNFTDAWREARRQTGIDRIPHDLRRTAVRNLEAAGVPRAAAMKMIGHKTESVYRRYSIVDHAMLVLGAERLNRAQKRHVAELRRRDRLDTVSAGVVH
jgi:site-specific recombinase XerD